MIEKHLQGITLREEEGSKIGQRKKLNYTKNIRLEFLAHPIQITKTGCHFSGLEFCISLQISLNEGSTTFCQEWIHDPAEAAHLTKLKYWVSIIHQC